MKPTQPLLSIALLALLIGLVGCEDKNKAAGPGTTATATSEGTAKSTEAPKDGAATKEEPTSQPAEGAEHGHEHGEHGHEHAHKPKGMPADLAQGKSEIYGGKFTIIEEPVAIKDAVKAGKPADSIKVAATVQAVCQKKGCWMTLQQEGLATPVRVKMKDYGFFLPKNISGANAVVEGSLKSRVVPQAEAQHYADDEAQGTGKPARKITGDQKGWEMIATAIEVKMPES